MAALAGDLSRKILGHSDAAKAFRPWWDTLEDNLLYAFVVMGKKMFISKLLACTVRPQGTRPQGARTLQVHSFELSPKFFQLHGFTNVGHSFPPQLHSY